MTIEQITKKHFNIYKNPGTTNRNAPDTHTRISLQACLDELEKIKSSRSVFGF